MHYVLNNFNFFLAGLSALSTQTSFKFKHERKFPIKSEKQRFPKRWRSNKCKHAFTDLIIIVIIKLK